MIRPWGRGLDMTTWPVVHNKADVCSLDFSQQQWETSVRRYTNIIQDIQVSEVVCLPQMSWYLREAAVRPFNSCYNHTAQNLRCPQSMKSKKEITNPLASFLENPNDSKSINYCRGYHIHFKKWLIHFHDICDKRMLFSNKYNNQRYCSTVLYLYAISSCGDTR